MGHVWSVVMASSGIQSQASTELASFVASMPEAYARAFNLEEAAEHWVLARRRADRAFHAELWRVLPNGAAVICVVADDRPQLLSCVLSALFQCRWDVLRAEIYTRSRQGGPPEVLDFFWLRPRAKSEPLRAITPAEVEQFVDVVVERLSAKPVFDPSLAPPAPLESARGARSVRVGFDPVALVSGQQVLLVEAPDRAGLLLRLVRALHRQGLEIVASEVRTEGPWVKDRFTVLDPRESPLGAESRQRVCEALRRAAERSD